VEVLTPVGLIRYMVLFVMDLKTRRVEIAGIRRDPDGRWMQQIGRNLTDPFSGFLRRARLLIHDRDPLFTRDFRHLLARSGVEPLKLPPQSPNLNAHAERFVRSIRQECLSRTIPLSERHLQGLVREYVAHYNTERNHQGIGNRLIEKPPEGGLPRDGPIQCRKRLGGMLNYYYREAA
jgi:transposase InsO family protein